MIFLILLYVVSLHLAVSLEWVFLELVSINLLILIVLWPSLVQKRSWSYVVLIISVIVGSALVATGYAAWLFYLPPILIPAFLCVLFARSLNPARTPIVTYVAGVLRNGDMPEEVRTYTYRVTYVWAVLLAILTLLSTALAILGDRDLWSFVTNVLFYAVMALAFLVEHIWHRIKFAHLNHPGFRDFVRGLLRIDYRQLY